MFKQSILAGAVAAAMAVGAAQATDIAIDVSAVGGTGIGASDVTDTFAQMQFYAETTTVQSDTDGTPGLSVGDTFADSGNAAITAFLPPGSYGAGIGVPIGGGITWSEITIAWTDLTGYLAGANVNSFGGLTFDQVYTGGTFNFYYEQTGDIDFGATVASGDDTGVIDGTPVLTLAITPGVSTGTLVFDGSGTFLSGSSAIHATVISAADGFWLLNGVDDFADLLLGSQIILSFIDQNTDEIVQVAGPGGPGGVLFTIDSNHDGSIVFSSVSVPVPGTVGLMGGALLALGGMGFARRRKA